MIFSGTVLLNVCLFSLFIMCLIYLVSYPYFLYTPLLFPAHPCITDTFFFRLSSSWPIPPSYLFLLPVLPHWLVILSPFPASSISSSSSAYLFTHVQRVLSVARCSQECYRGAARLWWWLCGVLVVLVVSAGDLECCRVHWPHLAPLVLCVSLSFFVSSLHCVTLSTFLYIVAFSWFIWFIVTLMVVRPWKLLTFFILRRNLYYS